MFGATWDEETFEIPHGEMDWSASAQSSEWEPDCVFEEPTPPDEPKEDECLKPWPQSSGSGTRTYVHESRFAPTHGST